VTLALNILCKTFAVVLLFAPSLIAHHSLGTYDNTKVVPITGTITKVDWFNPHVTVYLSGKNDAGSVVTRRVQLAGVGRLQKLGVEKNLFAIGSTVTFETWLEKSPGMGIAGRTLILADGRRLDVSDNLLWGLP
jgi:hypothetical protein